MKNNTNWLAIILVVIAVAVVVSLVTLNLSGNVISVARGYAGKVYTTAEVDAKLNSINTNLNELTEFVEDRVLEDIDNLQQGINPQQKEAVLDILRTCIIYQKSVSEPGVDADKDGYISGDEICNSVRKTCLTPFVRSNDGDYYSPIDCSYKHPVNLGQDNKMRVLTAWCCS